MGKLYRLLLDLVETFVIAGAIFVVIYAFLFRPYQVDGESMYPTFETGEYILTNIITLRLSPLQRGDIIVFKSPINSEKDYIKRVIGLPEDKVSLKNNEVYVNNVRLNESAYLPSDYKTYGGVFLKEGQEVQVPQDKLFVLGDNRSFSSDSREWGFVSFDKIIGKSFILYWPVSKIKVIEGVKYSI